MSTDVSEKRVASILRVDFRVSGLIFNGLHGVISQKTEFFLATAVRTSIST
jgi:hypothetical protein